MAVEPHGVAFTPRCLSSPWAVHCPHMGAAGHVSLSLISLQFLLGRKEDEAVLVGGEWSPSLDGLDPQADPQVLVRTAIRCAQAQTGIDLSTCTKW